jgi:hypothetical protein
MRWSCWAFANQVIDPGLSLSVTTFVTPLKERSIRAGERRAIRYTLHYHNALVQNTQRISQNSAVAISAGLSIRGRRRISLQVTSSSSAIFETRRNLPPIRLWWSLGRQSLRQWRQFRRRTGCTFVRHGDGHCRNSPSRNDTLSRKQFSILPPVLISLAGSGLVRLLNGHRAPLGFLSFSGSKAVILLIGG